MIETRDEIPDRPDRRHYPLIDKAVREALATGKWVKVRTYDHLPTARSTASRLRSKGYKAEVLPPTGTHGHEVWIKEGDG